MNGQSGLAKRKSCNYMKSEISGREEKAGIPNRADSSIGLNTVVFVSYAHEDEQRVRLIVAELEHLGWTVFWDRSIPVGKTWHSYIEHALLSTRSVVVVWSEFSIISEWVIEEAEYAKGKKILVPLLIDTVQPPFGFRRIQAANLSGWNNDKSHPEFQKCLDALTSIVPYPDDWQRFIACPVPSTPPNFVHIHSGEFTMGSTASEVSRRDDETQHEVKVSDYYICKYVVTLAEFRKFVEESGYRTDAEKTKCSVIFDGRQWQRKSGIDWRHGVSGIERKADEHNHPVLHVSWNDAVAYCKWLCEKTSKRFRLPTEAEWEYACRARSFSPFTTGKNLTIEQANYNGNYPYDENTKKIYLQKREKAIYRKETVPVDSFAPNAWGLNNMHGNVWEWCSDWYGDNYYNECKVKGVVDNPQGPETGSSCVLRGGSWYDEAGICRSAYRSSTPPNKSASNIGFRCVFIPKSVES